jgi:hypothetical protein
LFEHHAGQGLAPQALAHVQDFDTEHMTIRIKVCGDTLFNVSAIQLIGYDSVLERTGGGSVTADILQPTIGIYHRPWQYIPASRASTKT